MVLLLLGLFDAIFVPLVCLIVSSVILRLGHVEMLLPTAAISFPTADASGASQAVINFDESCSPCLGNGLTKPSVKEAALSNDRPADPDPTQ